MEIKNLLHFYIILLLNEKQRHGYELIKALELKTGKKISASKIYPFLQVLKRKKYIRVKKVGAREKKVYSLTSNGKKFVKNLLLKFSDLLELAIKPRLAQCAHCGCKIYSCDKKIGHKEKILKKNLVFCCEHCAKSYKKIS